MGDNEKQQKKQKRRNTKNTNADGAGRQGGANTNHNQPWWFALLRVPTPRRRGWRFLPASRSRVQKKEKPRAAGCFQRLERGDGRKQSKVVRGSRFSALDTNDA